MPHTKVDPAIIEALGLDPANSAMNAHGGSGFASTFKITSEKDGKPLNFFVKTGTGEGAEVMFKGTSTFCSILYHIMILTYLR
jgi:protein-ribulosamine 3-kinase